MTLLIGLGIMLVLWVLISWGVWSDREDYKGYGRLYKGEITTNFNAIPFARNSRKFIYKKWQDVKPKSGIDKEIADEEKEIAELKRRKEKIDRLEELKRYKKMLFEGVQESEVTDEYTHCRWCCGEDTLKTALTRDGISYHICTLCGHEQ